MKTISKRYTKRDREIEVCLRLANAGFSSSEISELFRIERTLHRWAEAECGDGNDYASWAIERDEKTGIPYRVTCPHTGQSYRTRIADREKEALKRLQAIMANHPTLVAFNQGDFRGCALYILRPTDIPSGVPASSCYTNGIAVCI